MSDTNERSMFNSDQNENKEINPDSPNDLRGSSAFESRTTQNK